MNLLEVGALLKKERERKGISIRDVMDATKISRRNLTALEECQVKSLPHPVYLKGYVRNIAKMVGLDADEMAKAVDQQFDAELGKYLTQAVPVEPAPAAAIPAAETLAVEIPAASAPAPVQQPSPSAQRQAPAQEREGKSHFTPEPLGGTKPKSSGTLRSMLVLILLVAVLIGLLVQYRRMYTDTPPAPVAPPVAIAPNATAADNASEALDNATLGADQSEPAAPSAPEPPRAAAPAAPAAVAPSTSIEVSRKAPAAEMRPPTPGMQQLTITAKADEVCWIQVSDGQQSRSFTLRNGEVHQVEFARRMSVRLGNAGGVSFRLNGQDYPYEGKRGSIDTVEFGAR